jgi:hypothetical protein
MLTREENELLCRVGPGAAMGILFVIAFASLATQGQSARA